MRNIISEKNETNCCGCGACSKCCPRHAIYMEEDENGFDYPKIDESKCTECGKCLKVCSFEKKEQSRKETYAAQAKDADLEENASGGIFTVLAQEVLKRKGIVYGCAMLYENQNLVIKHIGIDKIEELCKLKGSKYVQSNLENVYVEIKRHLEHNETVLFSGTPCQIAGLRGYLRRTYANLYTIEIICHGVPSAKLFQNYLGYIESKEGKKIAGFYFRDKSSGWKLYGKMILENRDGSHKERYFEPEESSYYQMFLNGYTYRKSCYFCPFASEYRQGDITIGDYWGIELVHPEYLKKYGGEIEKEKGVSCLIVNNEQGRTMLAKYGSNIIKYPSSYQRAAKYNAQLVQPSALKRQREKVMKLQKQNYACVERWYQKRRNRILFVRKLRSMIQKRIKIFIRKIKV